MIRRFFAPALVALALVTLAAAPAADAQGKIGYVDPEFMLLQMPEARQVRTQLEQQAEQDQQALQQLGQQLQQKATEYDQSAGLLSDAARQTREQELIGLQQQLQQQQQQRLQQLQRKEMQMMQPVYERFNTTLNAVAEEMGLSLVVSSTANGAAVLLYADESQTVDLTDMVANRLGISLPERTGGQ